MAETGGTAMNANLLMSFSAELFLQPRQIFPASFFAK
jgi:hypothetical protein